MAGQQMPIPTVHEPAEMALPERPEARIASDRGAAAYRLITRAIARLLRWWHRTPADQPNFRSWYQFRFDRYKRARIERYGASMAGWRCPSEPELVSIVLPVYNGERFVTEAIESVLSQSYRNFELILVDDGSTDSTPRILDRYAERDPRIRVVHQDNRRLPASLSHGFRLARGEFLTWTSDDNRLEPECLERLVACLRRHPEWEMVYANLDIIGDDGEPLIDSDWYRGYQVPPGSPHIHLPTDTAELNVRANNYVGAAFLYRDRVAHLLGDYSALRFTTEDYDYWQQVNELLNLRHADFEAPIYEYRFHDQSLTAREEELNILVVREFLMVFDDFRRDFHLTPLVWMIDAEGAEKRRAAQLAKRMRQAGHSVISPDRHAPAAFPRLWFPVVYVRLAARPAGAVVERGKLPRNALTVLAVPGGEEALAREMPECWDLCLVLDSSRRPEPTLLPYQGWYAVPGIREAFSALDVRARSHHLRSIEAEIAAERPAELGFSVVICTYRRSERLIRAVRSAARQSLPPADYEILLVNNAPEAELSPLVGELREELFPGDPDRLRLVNCPLKGLSHARNAGISEARGEVVCFLDDDAVARRDWLAELARAWDADPRAGVIGGKIVVKQPDSAPAWFSDRGLGYWSHFVPDYAGLRWVESTKEFPWGANWTARRRVLLEIGGFRCHYGRRGEDFGGGEELVAALLVRRLGYRVGVMPTAEVLHDVDPRRFTRRHLKKTLHAGTLVKYRLRSDLYLPPGPAPKGVLWSLAGYCGRLLRGPRSDRFERLRGYYSLLARLRLLSTVASDSLARASRGW